MVKTRRAAAHSHHHGCGLTEGHHGAIKTTPLFKLRPCLLHQSLDGYSADVLLTLPHLTNEGLSWARVLVAVIDGSADHLDVHAIADPFKQEANVRKRLVVGEWAT